MSLTGLRWVFPLFQGTKTEQQQFEHFNNPKFTSQGRCWCKFDNLHWWFFSRWDISVCFSQNFAASIHHVCVRCLCLCSVDEASASPGSNHRQPSLLGDYPSDYRESLLWLWHRNKHFNWKMGLHYMMQSDLLAFSLTLVGIHFEMLLISIIFTSLGVQPNCICALVSTGHWDQQLHLDRYSLLRICCIHSTLPDLINYFQQWRWPLIRIFSMFSTEAQTTRMFCCCCDRLH